jgi:predicted Co/Zn/Cd cation transporter (cation efflux family)
MNASPNGQANQRWLRMVVLAAIVYAVVGITYGALSAASDELRTAWRLAAWLLSAAAFAGHFRYEHFHLRNSPLRAALHTSLAVALGAFALGVWVNVHAYLVDSSHQLAPLALVLFPVVTGVPAFVVALIGALLARTRRPSQ